MMIRFFRYHSQKFVFVSTVKFRKNKERKKEHHMGDTRNCKMITVRSDLNKKDDPINFLIAVLIL